MLGCTISTEKRNMEVKEAPPSSAYKEIVMEWRLMRSTRVNNTLRLREKRAVNIVCRRKVDKSMLSNIGAKKLVKKSQVTDVRYVR